MSILRAVKNQRREVEAELKAMIYSGCSRNGIFDLDTTRCNGKHLIVVRRNPSSDGSAAK
jgi:hypothetical protein